MNEKPIRVEYQYENGSYTWQKTFVRRKDYEAWVEGMSPYLKRVITK